MNAWVSFFGRNTLFKKTVSGLATLSLLLGMLMPIIGSGKVFAVDEPLLPTVTASVNTPSITLPVDYVQLQSEAHNNFWGEWSFVNGPDGVTPDITHPTDAYSDVAGLVEPGTYTFKVTVSDFSKEHSAEATVDVVVNEAAVEPDDTEDEDLVVNEVDLVPSNDLKGEIRICKVTLDAEGNVAASATGTFTLESIGDATDHF
ncbi:MAG TPA: hypothetical protein VLB02_01165, partial [Candidatus Paceibacterota bacterium]|nr:hypothetical protein [Candidatus Paceibacterota bacterium]